MILLFSVFVFLKLVCQVVLQVIMMVEEVCQCGVCLLLMLYVWIFLCLLIGCSWINSDVVCCISGIYCDLKDCFFSLKQVEEVLDMFIFSYGEYCLLLLIMDVQVENFLEVFYI